MSPLLSSLPTGDPALPTDYLISVRSAPGSPTGFVDRKMSVASVLSAAGHGLIYISGATIGSPVAYHDIELPAGFVAFRLQIDGLVFGDIVFAAALSKDGGATFECDPANSDTYFCMTTGSAGTGDLDIGGNYPNSLISLTSFFSAVGGDSRFPTSVRADIVPGDAGSFPRVVSDSEAWLPTGPTKGPVWCKTSTDMNPSATVPPATGRVNLIRVLPWGNGDCAPPTSGLTITAGTFILWGIAP